MKYDYSLFYCFRYSCDFDKLVYTLQQLNLIIVSRCDKKIKMMLSRQRKNIAKLPKNNSAL